MVAELGGGRVIGIEIKAAAAPTAPTRNISAGFAQNSASASPRA